MTKSMRDGMAVRPIAGSKGNTPGIAAGGRIDDATDGSTQDDNRIVLLATSVSYVVVVLDTSIVNVALDRIADSMAISMAGLQWVVSAYTLAFASLLLMGGTMGDRWGARNIYLVGLLLFTLASASAGFALHADALIAARIAQGVGAALLVPAALKLINNATPDPSQRARAIGVWAGCGGIAMAGGPLVGGVLIHLLGWRSIFFVNVPIGLAGVLMAWRVQRDAAPARRIHFDPVGQITAMITLVALIGTLIEGHSFGWKSPPIIAGIVITVSAGIAFFVIENKHPRPMLPLSMFQNAVFSGSTIVSMVSAFVFYGVFFVTSLYYQQSQGYSSLRTGLALLPMTIMVAIGSFISKRMTQRFGSRRAMVAALACYTTATVGMLYAEASGLYWLAVVPMLGFGLASGFISPAATAPAMASVEAHRVGVAAAVLNTARQTGAALGVAIFGTLIAIHPPFALGMHVALYSAAAVSAAAMVVWGIAMR